MDEQQRQDTWEEKLNNKEDVDKILENLTENQAREFGVDGLYDLLHAKLKAFEQEKFGELDFTRSAKADACPELTVLKAEILDYKGGSVYKLSAHAQQAKTMDIAKRIDELHKNFNKEKQGAPYVENRQEGTNKDGIGTQANIVLPDNTSPTAPSTRALESIEEPENENITENITYIEHIDEDERTI